MYIIIRKDPLLDALIPIHVTFGGENSTFVNSWINNYLQEQVTLLNDVSCVLPKKVKSKIYTIKEQSLVENIEYII